MLKTHLKNTHENSTRKKIHYLKTQEKTPKQKTPFFEIFQKETPQKNTSSYISSIKNQTKKQ